MQPSGGCLLSPFAGTTLFFLSFSSPRCSGTVVCDPKPTHIGRRQLPVSTLLQHCLCRYIHALPIAVSFPESKQASKHDSRAPPSTASSSPRGSDARQHEPPSRYCTTTANKRCMHVCGVSGSCAPFRFERPATLHSSESGRLEKADCIIGAS
jgi:hypothetical protein